MGIVERKEKEKQQRKEEIIQAAEQVFFSRGFDQSTMDDIAEKAELSKGTLYLYFKSKEDLHIAVARKAIALLRSITQKATDAGGNAVEKLQRIGWACTEFSKSHPNEMKSIMTLEGGELGTVGYTASDMRNLILNESTVALVIQVVEQGVREKLVRSDIPAALVAHTLWMTVLSVIRFVSMEQELFEMLDFSSEKLFESHFELVLNGICL